MLPESILLAIGSIPYPVCEEVRHIKRNKSKPIPVIYGWRMIGQIYGTVTVAEGYARKVPEDEHEAPFLVVHVPKRGSMAISRRRQDGSPSCYDALLSLGACVCIQEMSHD